MTDSDAADFVTAEFHGATGTIHYGHWVPPRPRAVLIFFHGLGEHIGSYHPFAAALNAAGIAVWAGDHAGHGRSDGERVLISSVDTLADDAETLTGLVRAAHPDVPLILGGHSLGALISALLIAERGVPATALVLAGSSLAAGGESWVARVLSEGVDPWELRRDPGEMTRDTAFAQRIREDPLTWQGGLRPETLGALGAVAARIPAVLDKLTLPVLFVHGAEDDMAPVAGVHSAVARLPDARAAIFAEDRHNILNEIDRDQVYRAVVDFIAEQL
ncbi:alpha/beta hydrolase family protein [Nocardia nova SH22a]|uniref:Alpha/beta hydrolase family protein n=1 Tax=Nocardia nova SH22a TaxID=1415166 RepID=W5TFF9_9NOCA|nr:alpha/beta fold hydrolase [Nocardia nova]AHH17864.1 alpha/beta hydrolase family protein [Nocardia nova SH22a]